jgi:hypothetical protein
MIRESSARWAALAAVLSVLGCGGSPTQSGTGTVNLSISDAPVADWATVGVKVLAVSLAPRGGGAPVPVYIAPTPPPVLNLVQLDQLSELLASASVPSGAYTGAILTIAANVGDVLLVASEDPDPGFAVSAGQAVAPADILIRGATGSAGARTVSVPVTFDEALVVTAGQSAAVDVEFDLSHPVFIVDHPTASGTKWVVSFNGPARHRPVRDARWLLLRHLYGSVTEVDAAGVTFDRAHPVIPATNPETAVTTNGKLRVLADAANGTLYYDLDARTETTLTDFSSLAPALDGKWIRVAARYQVDGSLVAVRLWASSSFQKVWVSPEGHVLHVSLATNVLRVASEDGADVPVVVNAGTRFFFRTPMRALADAAPIGTGTAFLANVKRGFKVHVGVVDPLATPLVARTVDIEIARFDGSISNATASSFTYTRLFATPADDYVMSLDYLSSATTNGKDSSGNAMLGFKWWDFTFPTLADSGATAIDDFVQAVGTVDFGGSVGALRAAGMSYASWSDPANPGGWSASFAILLPTPVPLGQVSAPWAAAAGGGTFGMSVAGGANAVTVDVSSTAGSATLVYQVDRSGAIVTVTPVDVTTAAGLATVSAALVNATPVKAFGVPRPDGTLKAYILFYFTGTAPTQ